MNNVRSDSVQTLAYKLFTYEVAGLEKAVDDALPGVACSTEDEYERFVVSHVSKNCNQSGLCTFIVVACPRFNSACLMSMRRTIPNLTEGAITGRAVSAEFVRLRRNCMLGPVGTSPRSYGLGHSIERSSALCVKMTAHLVQVDSHRRR